MGTWGTGIFQNDIADDVKTTYINKLKMGKSDENALEETISENIDYLSDSEDSLDFWFSLASIMYDYGRLNEEIRCKVITLLESGNDFERWTEREYKKRRTELEKLKTKMYSEMPLRKKIAVTKRFECKWEKNDIFFAEIKAICDLDKDGFFVFCVSDTVEFDTRIKGLGDVLPVTYLKYVPEIPNSLNEIDDLPFILNCKQENNKDYRFLWLYDGFSRIKSKFIFGGNYDFRRPDTKVSVTFDDKLHIMKVWKNISRYI